jgi:hypothetical protein
MQQFASAKLIVSTNFSDVKAGLAKISTETTVDCRTRPYKTHQT